MTRRTAATVGIAVAILVAACGGSGSGWERFVSEEGGYSFLVAEQPEVERASEPTSFGTIDFTRYFFWVDRTLFTSLYSDLTRENLETFSAEELVSFAAENLIESAGGRLISDDRISVGGAPGRDTKIETATGRILQSRVHQVGARQFQISTLSDPEDQSSSEIIEFLESLRIE